MNDRKTKKEGVLIQKNHSHKVSLFNRKLKMLQWNIKESKSKRGPGAASEALLMKIRIVSWNVGVK